LPKGLVLVAESRVHRQILVVGSELTDAVSARIVVRNESGYPFDITIRCDSYARPQSKTRLDPRSRE
jgi:hypothetical protein